ncbi:MAG: hypothetical protein ACLGI2_09905 [Acidimicrobiia bacterium]
MKRSITLGAILTTIATLATIVVGMEPASASSTKCAFYGRGIQGAVRNGQFCSTVHGSGTSISTVTSSFGQSWPVGDHICNPSIKMDVYDRWGKWITWRQGPQKTGCFWGTWESTRAIPVSWSFPQAANGSVRVTLQRSGATVAENWHRLGCC